MTPSAAELEVRANARRARLADLASALDAKRHPRVGAGPLRVKAFGASVRGAFALVAKLVKPKPVMEALPQPIHVAALPLPVVHGPPPRPSRSRIGFGIAFTVLVVLTIGVRIALNPLAAHFMQKGLDELSGFTGTFSDVKVSVIPLQVSVTNLRLMQDGVDDTDDAVMFVKELSATALWGDLVRGRLQATAVAEHAKFTVKVGQTEAPLEVKEAAKEGAEQLKRDDFNLSKTFGAIIPFKIARFELRDSELVLIDATDPKLPRFWLNDVEFVVENLVSRRELADHVPLTISGRATVQKTGTLKLFFVADLLDGDKPAFLGQAQLSGLRLESLFDWAKAKAGVSPHGSLDVFANVKTIKNALAGDVKVMASGVKVDALPGPFSNTLKAGAANLAFSVLADESEKKTVATRLPLRGALTAPDPQIWPTVLGVVRNAFVDSLNWGFSDLPTPTAKKKEGVITQAVEALDPKKEAPKAQPGGSK